MAGQAISQGEEGMLSQGLEFCASSMSMPSKGRERNRIFVWKRDEMHDSQKRRTGTTSDSCPALEPTGFLLVKFLRLSWRVRVLQPHALKGKTISSFQYI